MIKSQILIVGLLLCAVCALGAVVEYEFNVALAWMNPDGYYRDVIAVNGQIPGPAIVANEGDTIKVTVHNHLAKEATAIHWHGIEQRGTPFMDGTMGVTQCGIQPGESFQYTFSTEGQSGTFWWHAHAPGQYGDGVYGPLIINAKNDTWEDEYDEDLVIMMSAWWHNSASMGWYLARSIVPTTNPIQIPSAVLINGQGVYNCSLQSGWPCDNKTYPVFTLKANTTYRVRLINAATEGALDFSIDQHSVTIIKADATDIVPYVADKINIDVAQRYDFLLTTNLAADNYWIRINRGTLPARAILNYQGVTVANPASVAKGSLVTLPLLTNVLVPLIPENVPAATHTFMLSVTSVNGRWFFNNSTFVHSSPPSLFKVLRGSKLNWESDSSLYVPSGAVVDIIINSAQAFTHPMHLHGHSLWTLGWGTGAYNSSLINTVNPLKRDAYTLAGNGWTSVRFVADNPGVWMFHCHNENHLIFGMGFLIVEGEDEIPDLPEHFPVCDSYPPTFLPPACPVCEVCEVCEICEVCEDCPECEECAECPTRPKTGININFGGMIPRN